VLILAWATCGGFASRGASSRYPTYFFIGTILTLVAVGLWRYASGHNRARDGPRSLHQTVGTLSLFMLLTAFSNGLLRHDGRRGGVQRCASLPPAESTACAQTLRRDGRSGHHDDHRADPAGLQRITLSRASTRLWSRNWREACSEAGICRTTACRSPRWLSLVLAANTAYADFPRLASIVARDRYPLRAQFMNQGIGCVLERHRRAGAPSPWVLLVLFQGDTHALIPL